MIVFHHLPDHFFPSDQYDKLPGAGQSGVEQIPGHQHGRAAYHRHDHHREFTALTFVNGQAVGQIQRVQLLLLVGNCPIVVEQHGHHMLRRVDALDVAHVAVKHALPFLGAEGRLAGIFDLIIVFGLNDLVAHPVLRLAVQQGVHTGAFRVQGLLQETVQVCRAAVALLGGGQHLNAAGGLRLPLFLRKAQVFGQTGTQQIAHGLSRFGLQHLAGKEKVRVPAAQNGHFPVIDPMGVKDDHAALVLPENIRQADGGHHIAVQYVLEHVACAHAGQLIRVAYQNDAGAGQHGPHQAPHEGHVHHAHFVHDQAVAFQRVVLAAGESAAVAAVFQQPVDGLGLLAGGLAHALGGAARRRAQENLVVLLQKRQDAADDGGFTGAGAACDDQNALLHGAADGLALRLGERNAGLLFVFGNTTVQTLHPLVGTGVHQPGQPQGDLAFRQIVKGQAKRVFAVGNGEADHHFFQQRMGDLRVYQFLGRMQHGCGPTEQQFPGQISMSRSVSRFAEQVKQRGPDAKLALGIHAHAQGNAVGGQETHAVDVHHHAVRIFADQLHRVFTIILGDAHGQIGTDAVILQKHQHPAHAHLLGVAFQDHGGFFLANAADLG